MTLANSALASESTRNFQQKFDILLKDQIKRKQLIHDIQILAKKKNYDLSHNPSIVNENCSYEWFVASNEPGLIDSLYYMYFWVIIKGKFLLEDVDQNSVTRLRKKHSFYLQTDNTSSSSLTNEDNSSNLSSDSLLSSNTSYIGTSPGNKSIFNHNSTTRFEKDILKARQSVTDLRSQFTKIIEAQLTEAKKTLQKNSKISPPSPVKTPIKKTFGNISTTPTSSSPVNRRFNFHQDNIIGSKVGELNLMDSPFIKNVLKFKFDMAAYINVLLHVYDITKEEFPLEKLIDPKFLPTPKIIYNDDNQICLEMVSRMLGYELLLFIYENPPQNSDGHPKFVYNLLKEHFENGLCWDFHYISQALGKLSSDIQNERIDLFKNLNKSLTSLIFELYKDKTERENLIKQYNLNSKRHIKIPTSFRSPSIISTTSNWKQWNELDFIQLNNVIIETSATNRLTEKRKHFSTMIEDEVLTYYEWNSEENKATEVKYVIKQVS